MAAAGRSAARAQEREELGLGFCFGAGEWDFIEIATGEFGPFRLGYPLE